ncbi:uncharacterized protein LOC121421175 isoform X1 [Lytechinus variegatus]|uniref:uncharacterized protein LOC121421175 isoform X1 n=1 Tax=Lytechinus variegatus TaxID=7654 RepID=UPI001BB1DDAD|nr:uncharacterized protein LOC121421175 isoform X1 [Lytechinus variegatus]
MSLRTRMNGFTAWVNLRLNKYDMLLKNVLMDLLGGTNMKMLLQSMTGIDNKKLQSFDGLTHQQKATRMEWIVKELKENEVIPGDIFVDFRLFAMRHAEHVFDLLWRLVSHDIWFTWDRLEYLTTNDDRILCEVPFEWTPKPPPEKKKKKKVSYQKSFLSGFGGASLIADSLPDSPNPFETPPESLASSPAPSTPPLPTPPPPPYTPNSAGSLRSQGEPESPPPPEPKHIRFPGEDFCKKFKKKSHHRPDPEECILEMVTTMLNSTREGRKLNVEGLDDLVDSRVLCELVNSFIPGTFTTEVLLNDRWSINLALKTFEKMIRINTPIDSSDLLEADPMAVCCAMCVYFMCGFKIRQAKAVINRLIELEHQTRAAQHDLDNLPEVLEDVELIKKRKMLKETLEDCNQERVLIESKFDVGACRQWWKHIETIQTETREAISKKMTDRFDQMTVPRAVSMNDLCISLAINLTLTQGSGFYLCKARETVTTDRRIVLKDAETGDFIDDFTHGKGPSRINIRKILGVSLYEPFDLVPSNYPQYEIYVESPSKNKLLKAGSIFLYQVFPGNYTQWENLFFKACKVGEYDTVYKLIVFFQEKRPSFINAREKKTGNMGLHMAARNGHYDIALFLLENGAKLDAKNVSGASPFFGAVEGLHKGISQMFRISDGAGKTSFAQEGKGAHGNTAQLLLEWGANIWMKNKLGKTAFDISKNDEQRTELVGYYDHLQNCIPRLMRGDIALLRRLVEDHFAGVRKFASLRSRCINGSTLIHTAAYFGVVPVLKVLLKERVDVNLRDYKGATPLHRAKDKPTIRLLLENGAKLNAIDGEGNTPLHVKCYGEGGQPTQMDCIQQLLSENINLVHRNHKELMAIHCCAMQGRKDAIQVLLDLDATKEGAIRASLEKEDPKSPPSLPHLSLANDFLECGEWLIDQGFTFKEHEQDILVHRLLTEQIKSKQRLDIMRFLFKHGADLDQRYAGGNTPLHYAAGMMLHTKRKEPVHYAAGMTGPTDILELLIEYGADLDSVNDDNCTPLFFATQSNNYFAASVLLNGGANVRHKNIQGLTAFDCIIDFDEWLECGFFTDEVKARLKAHSLKHARDLVRAITQKVRGSHRKGLFAQAALRSNAQNHGVDRQHPLSASLPIRGALKGNLNNSNMKLGQGTILPPLKPRTFMKN